MPLRILPAACGLRLRIELGVRGTLGGRARPQRVLPTALLMMELFLCTPWRWAPAAAAGLTSPVFAREKRRTTGEFWLGLGFELGLG